MADTLAPTLRISVAEAAGYENIVDDLAEILHACVHAGASVGFVLPFPREEARAFWAEKIGPAVAKGKLILLTAAVDGTIAGTVQVSLDTMPNQRHRADISKLLVHPRFRRRGIARALMLEAEDVARRHGRRLLTLDTRSEDNAEPLYRSLGFRLVGRIPGYAQDPHEAAKLDPTSVMYKELVI